MHIVQVFPHKASCAECAWDSPSNTGAEAKRKANMHADKYRPSIIVDRRMCSQKCLDSIVTRNIMVSLHDEDCPNNFERETNV
jgi:hypothetical protein